MKKKILITGATGFLGTWLSVYLKDNFNVYGIGLKEDYKKSLFKKLELEKNKNL